MKNSRQAALWSARNSFQKFFCRSFAQHRLQWCVWSALALVGAVWLGSAAWQRAAAQQVQFNINTVVGSTLTTGLVADFKNARGVVAASNGTTFYVADTDNHVVRRVDTSTNTVTIVAGQLGLAATTPTAANGDGAVATSARLNQPYDLALDTAGSLYISDTGNRKIRKVVFNGGQPGNISTIAGSGNSGLEVSVGGASFNEPRGLAYSTANNGTLYVADSANHRVIALLGLGGGALTFQVVAGNGTAGSDGDLGAAVLALLNGPRGLAVDATRLFIADTGNNKIRAVTFGATPTIDTFAGVGTPGSDGDGGQATSAQLNAPSDVAVDGSSNVYISDTENDRIRRVSSGSITTVAGTNNNGFNGDGTPATARTLNVPTGMVFVSNSVVFMDTGNRRLRRLTGTTLSTIVSDGSSGFSGDGDLATKARLDSPAGVAVDAQGNWYIADTNNHVIRRVNASDGKISTIAGMPGIASGSATAVNGDGGQATLASFNAPMGVAVDATDIYVADTGNKRIRKINRANNLISTVMGKVGSTTVGASETGLVEPVGVATDGTNIYVTDAAQHIVIGQNGSNTKEFIAGREPKNATSTTPAVPPAPGASGDGGLVGNARLNGPTGITVASGVIYVADTNNHRIRKIERINNNAYQITSIVPKGVSGTPIAPRAGYDPPGDGVNADSARLNAPTGVAVDSDGILYIADRGNSRIRRVAPGIDPATSNQANIITTAIGNGVVGFSGDGGPATGASLGLPRNIAAAANGILVADTGNNRIRLATQPPNVKPTLANPGNKTTNEGQAVTFTLQGSDTNAGQTLTYSMTFTQLSPPNQTPTLNPAPTLNETTGAFAWTPGFNVASSATPSVQFQFKFKATDNGNPALSSDEQTITITVNHVNGAPVVNSGNIPATLEATGPNGAPLQLNGTATDPDGDTVTVVWTNTRPSQSPVTIATSLTQTVTLALGQHSIILTANDGKGGTASTTAKALTVQDTTPPVFSNLPNDINETITSGNSKVVNFTLPTATDAVSGVRPVTATPPSGSTFPVGMTTVTFSSTDVAGNTRTATIKVTVTCTGTGCTSGGGTDPNAMNFTMGAFAGNGNFGTSGDGAAALAATLKEPRGVAMDASGNVYVADHEANTIRRVNAQGNISLFAGTGAKGFAGDGGAAANARFNSPTGLAVDLTRNRLYVADTGNQRIRQIDLANNTITTLAGNGTAGLGSDGAAGSTPLNYPSAVAVDGAGVVYVADTGNNRVVKISNSTLTTVAGNGQVGNSGDGGAPAQARLNHPTGVAVTTDGTMIFVVDRGNNRVRKITASAITNFAGTGSAATSGDNGQATAAALNAPTDVVVDGANNVFITETDGQRIRKVSASNSVIMTIAGTGVAGNSGDDGPATSATLNMPTALVRSSSTGVIFFCDTGNLRVRRLLPVGPGNRSPVPDPVASTQLTKSQSLNLALSATDADNDPVTFTLVPALPFVSITNANAAARTATLFINPAGGNVGTYNVRVQAADNKGGTGLTPEFTITVTDPNNNPPIAVMNTLTPTITIPSGQSTAAVNLNGSGSSDPDGDPLTYAWFNGATQIATGQTATVQLAVGQHSIRLTVTDNKGASNSTAPQSVAVQTGTPGNQPPVAVIKNLPSELVATNGVNVSIVLDGSDSSDPDGDPLTYRWLDGDNEIAQGVMPTVTLPVGQHSIKLIVTDDNNASGETTPRTVTITTGSSGPIITNVTPETGRQGQTITMTIKGQGFKEGCTVRIFKGGLPSQVGITSTVTAFSPTQLTVKVVISHQAQTGARIVSVTNPDGAMVQLNAFSVLQ
jgi:sugar lactone lactonase YvrE